MSEEKDVQITITIKANGMEGEIEIPDNFDAGIRYPVSITLPEGRTAVDVRAGGLDKLKLLTIKTKDGVYPDPDSENRNGLKFKTIQTEGEGDNAKVYQTDQVSLTGPQYFRTRSQFDDLFAENMTELETIEFQNCWKDGVTLEVFIARDA